jgi:hypothetical protein
VVAWGVWAAQWVEASFIAFGENESFHIADNLETAVYSTQFEGIEPSDSIFWLNVSTFLARRARTD